MADKTTVLDVFEHFSEDGHFVLADERGRIEERFENLKEIFPRRCKFTDNELKPCRRYYACKVKDFFSKEWIDNFDASLGYEIPRGGYEYTEKSIADSYLLLVFGYKNSKNGKFAITVGIVDPEVYDDDFLQEFEQKKKMTRNTPKGYYHLFKVGNGEHKFSKSIRHMEECLRFAFNGVKLDYYPGGCSSFECDLEYEIETGGDIKHFFPAMCGAEKPYVEEEDF